MSKDKALEVTADGGLILRGIDGDSLKVSCEDIESFGIITGQMQIDIDLYDPDHLAVQKLIDRLRSPARAEDNRPRPYPGQRMLANNTIIVPSRKSK